MDIVTHAMMGAITASTLAEDQPEAAAAFLLGSVLPDLDAPSRCFGKRALLRFWHFFGCARLGESVVLFRVDLWRGRMREEERVAILDACYEAALACRDLRTRNFGTRFGQLDLLIDARSVVRQVVFHV